LGRLLRNLRCRLRRGTGLLRFLLGALGARRTRRLFLAGALFLLRAAALLALLLLLALLALRAARAVHALALLVLLWTAFVAAARLLVARRTFAAGLLLRRLRSRRWGRGRSRRG